LDVIYLIMTDRFSDPGIPAPQRHTSFSRTPNQTARWILRFLDDLEKNRGNSVVSRNLRPTAIRSFYRMVALRDPASAGVPTRVLAISLSAPTPRCGRT
jgi:hypothetical protein